VPLTHCADLSAASWIAHSELPWQRLVGFGPAGLPAYARLRFMPDPAYDGQSENDVDPGAEGPSDLEQLRVALDILARWTSTPGDCYACLWDGWASDLHGSDGAGSENAGFETVTGASHRGPRIAPAFPPSVLDGPKVRVPHRAYFLFRGALADVGDWGAAEMWPGQPRLGMLVPAFVWPADRAWCVTNDVDPHWAGIGAATSAIDGLVADPRLDVVHADPEDDPPYYV